MKRRLFLTGPIGCGKSTAIAAALGERTQQCGGFLTRRYRDGNVKSTFLDFASGKPEVDLAVFSKNYLRGETLVLDEIGGIELLNPEFASALEAVLSSGVPILGVLKGEGAAGALIDKLGLTEEYHWAAGKLRQQLYNDPNTLVYTCTQYDENALLLVRRWVEEYCHD